MLRAYCEAAISSRRRLGQFAEAASHWCLEILGIVAQAAFEADDKRSSIFRLDIVEYASILSHVIRCVMSLFVDRGEANGVRKDST